MAHRYRLCPDGAQEAVLREHCAHARFVWNLAVEQQSWWRPGRGSAPSPAARMRQLAEARAAEPWLAQGSSSVQQQALRDFDKAMAAFFDPHNSAGKPSYRSRRGRQGFVIRDVKARRLNRNHAEVLVPKLGWVRFRLSRDLPAAPGMARVTCDRSGRWHVTFPGPQPAIGRHLTGAVAGIDRGVRTALVTSGGQHYRVPRISDRRAARYLALQRRMSRQQKGSRKREKTRRAMAAITVKVTGRRKDWAEKISTRLVRDHDLIVFEKLRTKDMVRKPKPVPDPGQWAEPDPVEVIEEELRGDDAGVLLVVEIDGQVAGGIQYHEENDPMYRHAGIDIYLDRRFQGQGAGTEAVGLLARYLFDQRGHHRITIDPAAANQPAIRCYAKVGFRPVGVMRQYERGGDGRFHDGLLMDLLRDELAPGR